MTFRPWRTFNILTAVGLSFQAFNLNALPDLTFHGPSANVQIVSRTFTATDCEVVEGCARAGTLKVLSFMGAIRNLGPNNLVIGPAGNNPLFVWAPCHGHYHFNQFAEYRLRDSQGRLVTSGRKMAFCLEDTARWNPSAPAAKRFNCNNQGLQAGWADLYDPSVPCQWIDITGLPGGAYTLEMVIDPDNLIPEANENNNVTLVPVNIPVECTTPSNDSFANSELLVGTPSSATGNNGCASKQSGEPSHAGHAGGRSVWYRWVAPSNFAVTVSTVGSDFDTLLAVYTGTSVGALTLIASNDDIVLHEYKQSRLTFNAVSNQTYRIAVDGWEGENGHIQVNINPPLNDAFAECQTLAGAQGTVKAHNIGATKETGERAHTGNIGGHSIWYCWSPQASGEYVFDTVGSGCDTLLAVYTGTTHQNLVTVAASDDFGTSPFSAAKFNAVAGANYKIVVDGFAGETGQLALNWSPFRKPSLSIRKAASNRVEIVVSGNRGVYDLETATLFTNWTLRTNFTLSDLSFTNSEIIAPDNSARAYRLRSQ